MARVGIALLSLIWMFACGGPATKRVVFEGETAEHKWTLAQLNPDLPADWTPYDYLVLEMRASSPQRFNLRFYSGEVVQSRQMQPLPNAWIRAAIPLEYYRRPNRKGFDLASVGKVPRNSFWISTGGVYGDLKAVDSLGISMVAPLGKPTIEIRSVTLSKEDPGSEVLEPKPLVDEFGQWIPASWPQKAKNLEQLKQEWAEEEKSLAPGEFNYCNYGGYKDTKAKATGYFRVEKVNDKWWYVDPDGHLFFSTSSTGMNSTSVVSRLEGRESYFATLPPADIKPPSFFRWNLIRRFGPDPDAQWMDLSIKRLDAWGFNTIGNWSDRRLFDLKRKPYVVFLGGWGMRESGYLGLPDVYDPGWPKMVDQQAAEQCGPRKNDPYLVGYYVANEPPWPGRESVIVDAILDGNPTATQAEAKKFLAAGDTPERRREFVYRSVERFVKVTNAAIRKHDPNHLNMGLRFGGSVPPEELLQLSKTYDVYSLNVYSTAIKRDVLDKIYQATGRPIVIGEFHFGVPANGMAAGLVQVRDEAERGLGYRYYVEQAASHPAMVGTSWFQWIDQPVTGRMDGENYNIGLVDVTDRPYREFLKGVITTHQRLYAVHSGTEAPYAEPPRPQ